MEYVVGEGRESIVLENLDDVVGQEPYQSPTVFNYYRADYQPARFPMGSVAPEFQIFTAPMAAGFLNGMLSLIEHGLSHCDEGFGLSARSCKQGALTLEESATMQETLAELDLMLSGGRLSNATMSIVQTAYEEA